MGGSIALNGVGLGQRSSTLDVVFYQRVLRKEIQDFPVLPVRYAKQLFRFQSKKRKKYHTDQCMLKNSQSVQGMKRENIEGSVILPSP